LTDVVTSQPVYSQGISAEDVLLVDEIVHYARGAYFEENAEAREFMLDALADMLADADTAYVDGAAFLASRKAKWGYMLVKQEELLRSSLEYVLSTTCSPELGAKLLREITSILGYEEDAAARMASYASMDCRVAKHLIALALLVPPKGVAGTDAEDRQ